MEEEVSRNTAEPVKMQRLAIKSQTTDHVTSTNTLSTTIPTAPVPNVSYTFRAVPVAVPGTRSTHLPALFRQLLGEVHETALAGAGAACRGCILAFTLPDVCGRGEKSDVSK